MKRCLLLFLSADRLHVQLMAGGKITVQHEFSDSPDDHDRFNDFLKTVKCQAYLLTDLIEEDFRHEIVPHLTGKNRRALLQRKFDQFYRNTPFQQATLLQRKKTGRRDDDMLFSALTNPALITPWLNIMLAQQIPLAGIYSVSQISAPLTKDHPSNHLLLISWEKYSGLRQTYFIEHRLQISRLTSTHDELSFQDAVVRELSRTYEYLKNLSLLPPGETLDVRLLGHRNDLLQLQMKLPRNAEIRYDFIELADLAQHLNIKYRFTDSDASQIFLHLLAVNPPGCSYAKPEHTHYNTLWQLRRALNVASATLLMGCLLWGGANTWYGKNIEKQTAILKEPLQKIEEQTQQITRAFPNTQASPSDMKSAVSITHNLKRLAPTPHTILQPISAALSQYPQIMLDELSWQMGMTGQANAIDPESHYAQTITLTGHLTDFATNYRAALNYLERFEHELAAQGYRVAALKKPLDVSASGNIAGQREASENTLGFSLQLSRLKPPVEGVPP
jgi:hypothetical protein